MSLICDIGKVKVKENKLSSTIVAAGHHLSVLANTVGPSTPWRRVVTEAGAGLNLVTQGPVAGAIQSAPMPPVTIH
jgi:hypothetical protein